MGVQGRRTWPGRHEEAEAPSGWRGANGQAEGRGRRHGSRGPGCRRPGLSKAGDSHGRRDWGTVGPAGVEAERECGQGSRRVREATMAEVSRGCVTDSPTVTARHMPANVGVCADALRHPASFPSCTQERQNAFNLSRPRELAGGGCWQRAQSGARKKRAEAPTENEAPRQGGAAPALPAPRSPAHLHAGHSADTCLSNFPQAPRHIKPLYRAGTSFLFLRQNLPPWPSAQGLAGPPQGPAATPPVTVASAYAEQLRRDPLLARKWKPHLKVTETAGTAL